MRKTCVLDYIKWMNDDRSFAAMQARASKFAPKYFHQGHRATLHDVRLPTLKKLPNEVLERNLVAVELAVDFFIKKPHVDEASHLKELWSCFDVLVRRLAPWRAPQVGNRVYCVRGHLAHISHRGHIYRDPKVSFDPDGAEVVHIHEFTTPPIYPPVRVASGIRSTLVYYGHQPRISWKPRRQPQTAMAQVRLYIKTTDDNRQELPRKAWRVRLEVTMNAAVLKGTTESDWTVGDLSTKSLRPIAMKFLALTRPEVSEAAAIARRRAHGGRKQITPLQGLFRKTLGSKTEQSVRIALDQGNTYIKDDDGVRFVNVPSLHKSIASAIGDFRKSGTSI